MESGKIIGNNIKAIRVAKDIKQEMLAKHIGDTKGRMSQIENGECYLLSIKKIEQIAAYLGTDFFTITSNSEKDASVCSNNFSKSNHSISPDLVKAVADELANRMSK